MQTIIAFYRPPHMHDIECFSVALDQLIRQSSREVVLVGNVNIDILLEDQKNTLNYLELMTFHGLTPFITTPTRVNLGSGSCIDHAMVGTRQKARAVVYDNNY